MLRITDDSALCTPIRDTNYCTLPGHPHSQCLHFVKGYLRTKANASLGWSPSNVVLYPISCKRFDISIIETNREIDGEFSFRLAKNLAHVFRETYLISS